MANARATADGNIDTAMATIQTNLTTYMANGGSAGLFVKWVNSQLATTDPAVARYIHRRFGSSNINASAPATLAASDVKP